MWPRPNLGTMWPMFKPNLSATSHGLGLSLNLVTTLHGLGLSLGLATTWPNINAMWPFKLSLSAIWHRSRPSLCDMWHGLGFVPWGNICGINIGVMWPI